MCKDVGNCTCYFNDTSIVINISIVTIFVEIKVLFDIRDFITELFWVHSNGFTI